jgi:L-alanine-DL-glutamate epimerase-like enolase superfamily enzyme
MSGLSLLSLQNVLHHTRPFGAVSDELDEELVAAARRALPDGVDLLIDGGGSSPDEREGKDWQWALRKTEMLARYGVKFYEEALHPTDFEGYQRLSAAVRDKGLPVKIAGMEVVQCPELFGLWMRKGHGALL